MKKGLRRVAAVAVTALVVAPALATVASATSTFAFDRLAGTDRYGTSVKVAAEFGASTDVILASGVPGHYPDALTASYLAGFKKAPIMLTQLAATPTNVVDRITASGATNVWLIGGTGVISAAQEAALDAKFGTVTRLGGLDRYLTAEKVIGAAGVAKSTTAVLATGSNFPDAIAGGPLSYVKGMPLAITATNSVPAATLRALKAAGTTKVIVLGGTTIVTPAVLTTLAAQTPSITLDQRIFGANRSETSSKLADYMLTSQGFSNTGVNVASGYGFGTGADALGGAPLSGKENRPTLITESVTTVGPGVIGYLSAHSATLASGHIFGGVGAVSAASEAAMQAAARATGAFTVTPATAATQATQTTRTYTVAGLTAGTAVTIALVNPALITGGTFTLAPGNRVADLTLTPSVTNIAINQINGVPVTGFTSSQFTPTGTSITFRVASLTTTGAEATPVVFQDNAAHNLVVNLNGVPTAQSFGVGGQISFAAAAVAAPVEAATAAAIGGTVSAVFGTTGFSTTITTTQFVMRAFDTYQFGGTAITEAAFKSILSKGDTLAASAYINGSTAATPNTFNITADAALVAVAPVATSNLGVVTVTYTPDATISANGTVVALQRASVVSGVTGPFATVKTGTITSLSEQTFTETLTGGTYEYRLIYTAPGFSGTAAATSATDTVLVTVNAALLAPTVQRLYLTSNATAILSLSSGDVFKVVTDAPMVQPVVGATLTVGGKTLTNSAATATAAGSATFTVNTAVEVVDGVTHAAGTVLTVKLLADTAGGNVAFTTSLTGQTGIANSVGALVIVAANATLTQDVVL